VLLAGARLRLPRRQLGHEIEHLHGDDIADAGARAHRVAGMHGHVDDLRRIGGRHDRSILDDQAVRIEKNHRAEHLKRDPPGARHQSAEIDAPRQRLAGAHLVLQIVGPDAITKRMKGHRQPLIFSKRPNRGPFAERNCRSATATKSTR
jgi:hypothetical protein